jgi:protein involved in polysaccharide export with SLBB domain
VNTQHFSNFALKIQSMKALQTLFFFSIFFFAMPAFAQLPADQGFVIKAELDKRGLTEAEAQTALAAKGFDIQKMAPEDLLAKKADITAILDELAASKVKQVEVKQDAQMKEAPAAEQKDLPTQEKPVPVERAPANPIVVADTAKQLPVAPSIYGHQIFSDRKLEPIKTTDGATAPETYVLGAGDQIRITIFGISQADLLQTINEAGFITPAGMAQIYLKGLTLKEARKLVRNRFSVAYRFQADEFAVTLQQARMLSVNIFGETEKSGSVQLSALNTALNALAAVGGPTELGSVRAIELIRGETRKKIDLYAFLNNPSAQFQFDLQHNDILFVPVVQKLITLEGGVKRPMRYELIGKEGIKELIAFAGGLNYNTYAEYVQVERNGGIEPMLLEYKLSEIMSGKLKIELQDGDIVRVRTNTKTLEQYTEVLGAVFYPGTYELTTGLTLGGLLSKAQLKPQASTDIYFVERTLLDGTQRILKVDSAAAATFLLDKKDKISVFDLSVYTDQQQLEVSGAVRMPFKKLLALQDAVSVADALALAGGLKATATDTAYILRQNLTKPGHLEYIAVVPSKDGSTILKAGDHLRVFDRQEYLNAAKIEVSGAVREPFEREVAFGDELKIADALALGRGLLPTASDIAYVRRRDWYNPDTYQYFKVNLKDTSATLALRAGDHLMIYDKSVYSVASNINVGGSVQKPQSMPYSPDLKLKDVLLMAGGKKPSADLNRVEVFRLDYSNKRGSGYERIVLKLDTNYNILGRNADFTLLPFDQILVRDLLLYNTTKQVEVAGEVKYPGTYPMPAKVYRLSDLLAEAGGLNALASKELAVIYRSANDVGPIGVDLKKALRHKRSSKRNPILMSGDVVSILPYQNTFAIRLEGTQYPQIDTVKVERMNFVYQGKKSARWYIREYAGGFAPDADKRSVAVAYPSGQVDGNKRVLYIFNDMPTVQNGGEIVITMKEKEKTEKEKKEVDYDAIFSRSFQAISSILTITLLLKQL